MPVPSLPVQELWNSIIDFLHGCPLDLRSISLVCRSFDAHAQSHIFREIALPVKWRGDIIIEQRIQADRLAALMESSPHLIQYVYSLSLAYAEVETLLLLARIPWSRLRTLSFVRMFYEPGDAFLNSINALVGLQSLRSLKIGESRSPDYDPLPTILSHCSAGLESVAISYYTTIAESFLGLQPRFERPRIKKLTLCSSPRAFDLLNDSACPFDFTTLRHVKVQNSAGPGLDRFLRQQGKTVEQLSIAAWGALCAWSHTTQH
jgi:hypothetical protein